MYTMVSITGLRSVETEVGEEIQGFLTSANRFVDRKEAWIIAKKASQIKYLLEINSGLLYSEHLYKIFNNDI